MDMISNALHLSKRVGVRVSEMLKGHLVCGVMNHSTLT
jgi:hypothetical protein